MLTAEHSWVTSKTEEIDLDCIKGIVTTLCTHWDFKLKAEEKSRTVEVASKGIAFGPYFGILQSLSKCFVLTM